MSASTDWILATADDPELKAVDGRESTSDYVAVRTAEGDETKARLSLDWIKQEAAWLDEHGDELDVTHWRPLA